MRVIEGHHDFGLLEGRLIERIREARSGPGADPFRPVLVIAPTRWLITHIRLRLAEAFPGLLGVHVLHHDALAREAVSAAGERPLRALSSAVRREILAGVLEESGGELAAFASRRPGAVRALLSTMNDLREAGVEPAAAGRLPGLSPGGREILRLCSAYASRLESLCGSGVSDRAGVLLSAAPHAPVLARRFGLVLHYGAYELIGVNLRLMQAVESGADRVVYLVPSHPESIAHAHARAFWEQMLGSAPDALPGGPAGGHLLSDRLPFLYDETRDPAPPSRERIRLFRAQGAAAELRETALRIVALHRDTGVPLHRIAVIARSLQPYAAQLGPVFDEHGLPFETTAVLGAQREARVLAVLHLVRSVLGDFQRQPLLDLCRSGLLSVRGRRVLADADAWDRLSREWAVPGGFAAWTSDLPAWIESSAPECADPGDPEAIEHARARREGDLSRARSLASIVRALRRAAAPVRRARSWSAWAAGLEALVRAVLPDASARPEDAGGPDQADDPIAGLLSDMRDLDLAAVPFQRSRALAFLESALGDATLTVRPSSRSGASGADAESGGLRVLDAMQARGLTFDAVYLIGFNADLVPRRPREDPFLRDRDRRLIRSSLAAPLPIKAAGRDEERLLMAHLLGAARRALTVSWQHADESGRAKIPSLALREVARAALGAADLRRAVEGADRVPGHPAAAGLDAARRLGLLSPMEASLGAALELGAPEAVRAALPRLPLPARIDPGGALEAGLEMLEIIEAFDGRDLRHDVAVGGAAPPPGLWSPSRLEDLGICPQRYFFRRVLRADELPEVLEHHEVEARQMGSIVHAALRDVYRGLLDAGFCAGADGDPGDAVDRAHELANAAWSLHARPIERRMRPRHPLLWRMLSDLWLAALREFLAGDVAAIVRGKIRILGVEQDVEARIPLAAGGPVLSLRGRFDRVVSSGGEEVTVADYKSGGHPERHVDLAGALKGRRLQLPLYVLLAESGLGGRPSAVRAEVIGVGPGFESGEERGAIEPAAIEGVRDGLLETLAVLVRLADTGFYPLNDSEPSVCGHCPYTEACRRAHPPTRSRLDAAPAGADYRRLARKNTRKPLMEDAGGGERSG